MCVQRIVIYLLDFLIERLLCIVKLQLLVLLLDAGITDVVTRLETIEDGYIKAQPDILREIVLQLGAKGVTFETTGSVIVGTKSSV